MVGVIDVINKKESDVERININLLTNQASNTDVYGVTFTVSYGDYTKDYVWENSTITISIPAYVNYTISFRDLTNYKKPNDVTYTAQAGNSRTLNATYQTCVLSVNIADNQTSLNDIASVKATVKGSTVNTSLSSGGSVKVPFGEAVAITGAALTGYTTPSAVNYTAADANKTVTLTYNTTLVKVAMADNQSAYNNIANAKATVAASGITTQTVSNGGVVKVPTGVSCTVTWKAVTNYKTPAAQTFTTSGSAATKTGTYRCQVLTVNVVGNGATPSGYTIAVNNSSTGAIIGTQTTASKVYKIPFGTSYTVSASIIDGYNAVASLSGTANVSANTITMTYVFKPVIDLSLQDIYGNPIARSTANCYVVKEAGWYKFPLVYGNAIKNGKVNTAAFTNNGGANSSNFMDGSSMYIRSPYITNLLDLKIENTDIDGVIENLELSEEGDFRYVNFKINSIPSDGGNIIIGYGASYTLWSWHIWIWPHDLSPVEITNATGVKYNIMPVNLASKYDPNGVNIKNWFYQWGRPNPMLLPSAWNSATDHTPGSITKASRLSDLYMALQNPTTFYYNSDSYPYNWFGFKLYYNLWDAACIGEGASDNDTVKTVYDPCPVGWKVPNGNVFTGLTYIGYTLGIVKFARYSGDTIGVEFPISGRRNSEGSISNAGITGFHWTSTFLYEQVSSFSFVWDDNGLGDLNVAVNGLSIRPVQDDNIQLDVIMISFKIYNTTYQAESGMSWSDWVRSEYNTGGYYEKNGGISDDSFYVLDQDYHWVIPGDKIQGIQYTVETDYD